jgi:branched-chain amino acid transport system ATP-binding protein
MSLLEVDDVVRRFSGVTALDGVSMSVDEDSITGLIGPNGAGKSTLFGVIAGALRPTSGRVRFAGRDVTGWRPHRAAAAGVARTVQLMRVFGSMTVRENVVAAAYLQTRVRRAAYAHAAEVLDATGLAELAETPAHALTAPSKKRLEIARALATRPKLLLLDEVLAGLTPTEGRDAIALLRRLNDDGVTILMVEHVMEVIMPVCHRLVVLSYGSKISEGTPEQVAHDPAVIDAYLGGAA